MAMKECSSITKTSPSDCLVSSRTLVGGGVLKRDWSSIPLTTMFQSNTLATIPQYNKTFLQNQSTTSNNKTFLKNKFPTQNKQRQTILTNDNNNNNLGRTTGQSNSQPKKKKTKTKKRTSRIVDFVVSSDYKVKPK